MAGHSQYQAKTALGHAINELEELIIAFILGVMTILTFINVVLRYGFNSSIIWGLEVVAILFSWLVLFGIAYGFKVTAHLGVDAILNMAVPTWRRRMALLSGLLCIVYAFLMLKGAWDYWAPFAGLEQTTGRWFPTGFDENTRDRAFFETDQVPMLGFLRWLEDAINMGETYSKMPRVVPYTMLPVAAALTLYRVIEATWAIWKGERQTLIVSHEAEDAVEDVAAQNRGA